MMRIAWSLALGWVVGLASLSPLVAQQRHTPSEFIIELFAVEISTDGTVFLPVFEDSGGVDVDLADPNSFADAFGEAAVIDSGTYNWIRMTIGVDLRWSHPAAPVSLSDQVFTVNGGPPGPTPGQMMVYFATPSEGGTPSGNGGGEGTAAAPFLLGSGAEVIAGANTTLRVVFVVTETLKDQGGGVYELAPPQMFFVSENDNASSLSGSFNTTLYNAVKDTSVDNNGNTTLESWAYSSGGGVLSFDGDGAWAWSGTLNEYDLLGQTGAIDSGASVAGRYGISQDGSIWMIANGEPGTLRGAVSADGSMIVASMFDSPTSHLMVFGVRQATAASTAVFDGDYYFTIYGTDVDDSPTNLEYKGSFGTVSIAGDGALTGTQDANRLRILDPTGTPVVDLPETELADDIVSTMSVAADGTLSENSGAILGAILENGDAATIAFEFSTPYNAENQFGFIVRQSPAGTFNTGSLRGTYFGGHFGDVYRGGNANSYFSGFFQVTFNGQGAADITLLENREGEITTETFTQAYLVDSSTGFVTFIDLDDGEASDMFGAIGPRAESFILSASAETTEGAPNDQRFLGLGLRQGS